MSDRERFSFYIEAGPGFSDDQLAAAFQCARREGLVAVDLHPDELDENDQAVAEGRTILLWLKPADPYDAAGNPLH